MAEARISQDEFMCSVCLDILKDPVAIPCGHSYCKICITGCWDQEDQMRVYSCPRCRQTFSPRPALAKNTILAEMVETLKKTKLPADCYPGAGDVQCDACTGTQHKAVKSCLVCLESYCQTHFDRHEEFHSRKPHKMTDATGQLKEMICHQHDKLLEVFCRTDQKYLCVFCMDEHKHHDTVLAAAQRTEKQKDLKETQRSIQQREKDLEQLRVAVESRKRSAQTAVEDSEKIFTERQTCSQVPAVKSKSILKSLRSKSKSSLKSSRSKSSQGQVKSQVFESFQSLSAPSKSTDVNDSSDGRRESVYQLRDKPEDFCKEKLKRIPDRVTLTNIVPWTRNDFQQYSHQLTLDLNTMNEDLHLSERNRVITNTFTEQLCPDHPDRFDYWPQVLCRESVCGRCYWEIEWSGDVSISVSYESISRKGSGDECLFGRNNQSWSLICSPSSSSFRHNDIETKLPVKSISSRIGVCVDHSEGALSFYSIYRNTMSLIHTVQTTFTKPLYPGFGVGYKSSVKLLMKESSVERLYP
ncbi:E3 ubiquitin-protein ligase TRIM16-like isoform X1 [Ctenopharyngodon idella]|uniref:E3 ubiquitin-protein ligase TRIM16-like isoform X1 n=1 Tax=Ctenopharyngodon idella TaxID=7959 RepID=UPI00222FBF7B|nr:E3 ubiquitin-protein ligase TRIM16-like isoform X1 [Ctenopharyngodon idella]